MRTCLVYSCNEQLTRSDHDLCYRHWKINQRDGLNECDCGALFESKLPTCPSCEPRAHASATGALSSTKIGTHFELSAQRINLMLAELGWIEKGPTNKGWAPTQQGVRRGAQKKTAQSGVPYSVWPQALLEDRVFVGAVREFLADETSLTDQPSSQESNKKRGGRPSYPATHRASDGHLVRSRGEMLIDNWLYMAGIVHAYERRVPIEEEVYCDFWIPEGKVYMEYWGLEGDSSYDTRKQVKLAIYRKHDLNLIQISNDDIANLDDVLPRKLLEFKVRSK